MSHQTQSARHDLEHGGALLQPPASDLIRVGSRRWFLQAGIAGLAGLSLPNPGAPGLRGPPRAARTARR